MFKKAHNRFNFVKSLLLGNCFHHLLSEEKPEPRHLFWKNLSGLVFFKGELNTLRNPEVKEKIRNEKDFVLQQKL